MPQSTVVLLHGLGRTFLSMKHLGAQLTKRGFQVLNYQYRSRHESIARQAKIFDQFLNEQRETIGTLSFVTHSLGSIILRRFIIDYGANYSLDKAVMLGPPNQGSSFGARVAKLPGLKWLLGPALIELTNLSLSPGTDLIKVGIIAGATGGRGYSPFVSGDNDGIVAVSETALEGAKDWIQIRGLHSFLMYNREAIKQTIHFLEHEKFCR